MAAARVAARDVIGETGAKNALSGRIVESYRAALERGRYWASLRGGDDALAQERLNFRHAVPWPLKRDPPRSCHPSR